MACKESCIQRMVNEDLLIIRTWQLKYCDGNTTACALLSFFEYWHTTKLEEYARTGNPTDLLQYHTFKQLEKGILWLSKQKTIRNARQLLIEKGAITIHQNPDPEKADDRTTFYLLNHQKINHWLNTVYVSHVVRIPVDNVENRQLKPMKIKKHSNQRVNEGEAVKTLAVGHSAKKDNAPSQKGQCFSIHKISVHKKTPCNTNKVEEEKLPSTFDEWCEYFIYLKASFKSKTKSLKFRFMIEKWLQRKYKPEQIIEMINLILKKTPIADVEYPQFFSYCVDKALEKPTQTPQTSGKLYPNRSSCSTPEFTQKALKKCLNNLQKTAESHNKLRQVA